MQAIKDFIFDFVHLFPGGRIFTRKYLLSKHFLTKTGWKRSVQGQLPVDATGRPIPWFTYSSIHFLQQRLHSGLQVFEFGSGNSTLWLSERVERVVSLEHDPGWHGRMKPVFGGLSNIEFLFRPLEDGAYSEEITRYPRAFDLVIVDGRDRSNCARKSVEALRQGGVILWDDSQREEYLEGQHFLHEQGFKRLDFFGAGPISAHASCTTLFYKDENCLGI